MMEFDMVSNLPCICCSKVWTCGKTDLGECEGGLHVVQQEVLPQELTKSVRSAESGFAWFSPEYSTLCGAHLMLKLGDHAVIKHLGTSTLTAERVLPTGRDEVLGPDIV